nr:uncharacterized protein si:ch211-277c7.7 [Misgurnus anguillicaudatus]
MATQGKSVYIPRFGSQSSQSQTDNKVTLSGRICRLSKSMKRVTCVSSSLTVSNVKSPEITPCCSKIAKTNYLLRFYWSAKANRKTVQKSTDTPMTSNGEKSQSVKDQGSSSDYFEFPPEDAQATDEKSRIKQDVLRTIRRMIEENRVIRQRLLALSQMSQTK